MKGTVLILGATSSIARATAAGFAKRGYDLFLAARDTEDLPRLAADMSIRYGVIAHHVFFDAEDTASHTKFMHYVQMLAPDLQGVVVAFGYLGDAQESRKFAAAEKIIQTNFTGAVSMLSLCADIFEEKRSGFIIGISSVAGDRGRQSNYTYGSAKGALSLYLQGLRNRLHASGVRVITIKPGFVDTAMTYGLPGMFLVASPESVGERIAATPDKSSDVVYVPGFWRWIMLVIRLIPEAIFKRMKL